MGHPADWIWYQWVANRFKYITHAAPSACCRAENKCIVTSVSEISNSVPDIFARTHHQALGRWLLPMLLHWNEWVHRRVTTVSFVNERQFHRHVSIDFTIPTWRASPGYNSTEGHTLSPLLCLRSVITCLGMSMLLTNRVVQSLS